MENTSIIGTPFDDVFRTLLNDCSTLIIPLINEIFGEHYTGKEKITFSPDEHFLNRQDGNEEKRITDTSFRIEGLDGKESKKYHLECQRYTLQEIFEKNLLLLIPFYIFSHEAQFEEYEKDRTKLENLQAEYAQIKDHLEELVKRGVISEYIKRTLIEMSNKVL